MKDILGEDPSEKKGLRLELHPKIKNRLKFWAEKGLSSEDRDKLLTKYKRSEGFEAPKINLPIESNLSVSAKKRDTFRVLTQNSIGSALMAIVSVASTLITETEALDLDDAFEKLFEAKKILADAFHQQSLSRKATITPSFDKMTKEILEKANADEFLFGKDLVENIKSVKAADKVVSVAKTPAQASNNQGKYLNSSRPKPELCVATTLNFYVKKTKTARGKLGNLFISTVKPLSRSTVTMVNRLMRMMK
ncbi:Protein of unknown function, partial [Cotesia congregata]